MGYYKLFAESQSADPAQLLAHPGSTSAEQVPTNPTNRGSTSADQVPTYYQFMLESDEATSQSSR
ncbi:hypothetical protein PtA15_2A450 [Puccinia triticina]|uniref:Uncharacterized protein n=1 Tax=Puccinia triticina TaxID=208348 RepID=A0ABY7CDC7_9BASI|nr:uncharacterized protein PtA15_2A450 [Puccinia triticina]WAQ82136.1 hypothetical protein PtA15_2A450 [Puccinia triticina]